MLDYHLALQWLLLKLSLEESSRKSKVSENEINNSVHCSHGFEVQVSEGGEAGLFEHFTNCKKNPDHKKFIRFSEFHLEHLPEAHRDLELYEFIKTLGDMTVRVGVSWSSENKKETLRSGSGRVFNVCKYVKGQDAHGSETNDVTCPCHDCQQSDTAPSKVWWELHVETAAHVVQDSDEASRTSLRLFYDDEDSPPVILKHLTIKQVNPDIDRCHLKCITCDTDLGSRLEKLNVEIDQLWTIVHNRYSAFRNSDTFNRLTIIVSHPHGCAKTVTIGLLKTVNKDKNDQRCSEFNYTPNTCPGSSGAYVFILGHSGLRGKYQPVHHGISDEAGLNYSIGWILGLRSIGVERDSTSDKR